MKKTDTIVKTRIHRRKPVQYKRISGNKAKEKKKKRAHQTKSFETLKRKKENNDALKNQ